MPTERKYKRLQKKRVLSKGVWLVVYLCLNN